MPQSIVISACSPSQFEAVTAYIRLFELDDRALKPHEFVVALHDGAVAGFGRIRDYEGCSELCSLGVIEPERFKGIGTELAKALVRKATQPLYLVCIIPGFFERLGFSICDVYPVELAQKLDYCRNSLPVPEPYVVMVKK